MLVQFEVFGVSIAMYGLLILIGLVAGVWIATLRAPIYHQNKEDILFASLFSVIGLVIGAKLLYLITILPQIIKHFDTLIHHPQYFIDLLTGGFVYYGGLFGAILGIFIYTKKYRLSFWPIMEILVVSVPLVHAFGRLGCFCAGCCYGKPFPAPVGMLFDQSPFAPHGVTLFPVQLLEAGLNFILFMILIIFFRKQRRRGVALGSYLFCYAIMRFFLEYLRYDEVRGFLFGISTSQWISILLIPISIYLLFIMKEKPRTMVDKGL